MNEGREDFINMNAHWVHEMIVSHYRLCVQAVIHGIPFPKCILGRSHMPFSMSPRAMNHHYSAYIFT